MTSTLLQKLTETTRKTPVSLNISGQDIDFEIRIPLKAETEKVRGWYSQPDESLVESEYARIRNPLMESVADVSGEKRTELLSALNVIETDDDLFIKGTSVRIVAKSNVGNRLKTEWLFSLINDLDLEKPHTYEELAELLPESVIRSMAQAIEEAIQPNYEVSRKKS